MSTRDDVVKHAIFPVNNKIPRHLGQSNFFRARIFDENRVSALRLKIPDDLNRSATLKNDRIHAMSIYEFHIRTVKHGKCIIARAVNNPVHPDQAFFAYFFSVSNVSAYLGQDVTDISIKNFIDDGIDDRVTVNS